MDSIGRHKVALPFVGLGDNSAVVPSGGGEATGAQLLHGKVYGKSDIKSLTFDSYYTLCRIYVQDEDGKEGSCPVIIPPHIPPAGQSGTLFSYSDNAVAVICEGSFIVDMGVVDAQLVVSHEPPVGGEDIQIEIPDDFEIVYFRPKEEET